MTGAQPHGGLAAAVPARLVIDGEFTIYRAEELKQALIGTLPVGALPVGAPSVGAQPTCAPLECDLAGVTEFDTAGVQLLLLAAREARQRGGELRLVGISAVVAEVFELLNLPAHFDADAVSPPVRC